MEKDAKKDKNNPNFRLTTDELKAFVSILMFSGYLSSKKDYWSEHEDPGIGLMKNCMPGNPYIKIKP